MTTPIEFNLGAPKGRGCIICCDHRSTRGASISATVDYEGEDLQICGTCLRDGVEKIREALEKRACDNEQEAKTAVADLLKDAADLRDVAARIKVPTYEEYEAAEKEQDNRRMIYDAAFELLRCLAKTSGHLYQLVDLSALDDYDFCLREIENCNHLPFHLGNEEMEVLRKRMPLIVEQARAINTQIMTYDQWASAERPAWAR